MPGIVAQANNGRLNRYGVELAEEIVWRGWEPGKEYIRNLILKNVRVKTIKLKFRGPNSRFFTTLYPKPIVLSAGTSYTLPITFRPLEKVFYEDSIEFTTNDGIFQVPLRSVLPQTKIVAPERINFSMCAAHDFVQVAFEIRNSSEVLTPFQFETKDPFSVSPVEGILEPYATLSMMATFSPKAAVVYDGDIILKYGDDFLNTEIMRFEGVGKYPHLLVSSAGVHSQKGDGRCPQSTVDFGIVPIGKTVERWIDLENLSPVNAPFTIERPEGAPGQLDAVFLCSQKRGLVPALSSARVPISFTPNTVSGGFIEYFLVKTIGNISKTVVTCTGASKGPLVHLNKAVVNFMLIDLGQTATKTIDIVNESDVDATFQFQIDCDESAFKFQLTNGILPPTSRKTIIINFNPAHAISYHRRVACLIHNQDPVFIDLLGTCHSETTKPAVLQAKHLRRFELHNDRGLASLPPEQLNEMRKEGKLLVDGDGALFAPSEDGKADPSPFPAPVAAMDEFFNDGYYSEETHHLPQVSLDTHLANFGRCADFKNVEQRSINITNHTKGKITIVWMGDMSHSFFVSPCEMEIPPQKSSSFTITFKPKIPNLFFGAELECYAFYKSLRDYRLVEDATHCPPWCMTLMATAHTFNRNVETFLPRYNIDASQLVFPAVNANEATYRTLCLSNSGATPILYDFQKDKKGVFSLKPTTGLLSPGQHQIFTVKCLPKEVSSFKHQLALYMNDMEKNTQDVTMHGSAETPEVLLDNQGVMYFKPTCIGTVSLRKYGVKNVSRIPLCFEWKMKHTDAKNLVVEPASGVIQPNAVLHCMWRFLPSRQEKHLMKASLIVHGQGQSTRSSGGKKKEFVIRVIGEGSVGEIKAEQTYIDCGPIVVGTSTVVQIPLMNEGDCSLHYTLHIEQTLSGIPEETSAIEPHAIQLESLHGVLPARSKRTIEAVVCPTRRVYYQWSIAYMLLTPEVDESHEPQHLCHVLATGVYPSLVVTDARCSGSAVNISKKQLWNYFCIDDLNKCLDSDPSSAELIYAAATKFSTKRRPPIQTKAIVDFNFGAAPVGSDPCCVQLMFENTGTVTCEWNFLFPSDLQLELEYWAETGDYDDDELHEMKVMDNKLFSIDRPRGVLEPGECQTVQMSYVHAMPGTDRLPVLLKLNRGREVLLNFVGVSVECDRPYIHFPSNRHMFAPTCIGDNHSAIQMYELYNGGSIPVKFAFDLLPLQALKEENYNHSVFECLNPSGEILPGHTTSIEWKFFPLEAKTYMVDIPIHIHNSETALITFAGVGYDQRIIGDTMKMSDDPEQSGVPSIQSVPVPGQLCYLSEERITFGNIPLFSRSRRVIAITNKSTKHAACFVWHVTSTKDSKFVQISPRQGHLEPGCSLVCKVTFTARGFPSFYDLDLICEVSNMTEQNDFISEMNAWETERQRQRVEFTITEDDLDADLRIPAAQDGYGSITGSKVPSRSGSAKSLATVTLRSIDAIIEQDNTKYRSMDARNPSPDFAKYKTLPPIKQSSIDAERSKLKENDQFDSKFWARPEPPGSFLLHLGITARSHDIAEFQANFADKYTDVFIDRTLSEDSKEESKSKSASNVTPQDIECLESESNIVASALTNILRGLLDDTQFHESCQRVMAEPVPYFQQYCPPQMPDSSILINIDTPTTFRPSAKSTPQLPMTPPAHESSRAPSAGSTVHTEVKGDVQVFVVHESLSERDENTMELMDISEDQSFNEKQVIKKTPGFNKVAEGLMENTLMNIIEEAFHQEFNITTRPRLVALLPKQTPTMTPSTNRL